MSETTPTDTASRSHLQAVREDTPQAQAAAPAPARQGGGHMTGLLALLLAVAVFAFLAQFSANRKLQDENASLKASLAGSEAALEASQAQMSGARDALGGLRDVLTKIEGMLAPASTAD